MALLPELVLLAEGQSGHPGLQLRDGGHAVGVVRDEGLEPAAKLVLERMVVSSCQLEQLLGVNTLLDTGTYHPIIVVLLQLAARWRHTFILILVNTQ